MHELALSESILEILLRSAEREGLAAITRVVLEIGEAAGVDPEALRFCFDAVTARSPAQGAELRIETVPARGRCRACAHEFPLAGPLAPCPRCAAYGAALISGQELRVREFEGE